MILLDTSIWIDLLRGTMDAPAPDLILHHAALCPPIVQEIPQAQTS